MKLVLKLTRPATAQGGDRYEVKIPNELNPLVIYLPQSISRKGGVIQKEIKLEIT
jgi:hypothetical protein